MVRTESDINRLSGCNIYAMADGVLSGYARLGLIGSLTKPRTQYLLRSCGAIVFLQRYKIKKQTAFLFL